MAVQNFVIPVTNVPQQFQITLANVTYQMTCKWNDSIAPGCEGGWALDIDDSEGNPIIHYVPLITGIDLLSGLAYLGINGSLYVYTASDTFAVPTLDNLGMDSNLYFQTEAAS